MKVKAPEKEYRGSLWKHPYTIYIILTVVLFAGLLFMGWLAMQNGWIPNRGMNT